MLIVERHQQGWKQAHIADAMGIALDAETREDRGATFRLRFPV